MGEELTRKKRVRAGHKSSATKMMTRVEEMLASGESLDLSKLNQLRMSLREKLEEIKVLDSEILSLVKDDEVDDEITQADLYKEKIYSNLILMEKATGPAPAAAPTAPAPSTRLPPRPRPLRLPAPSTRSGYLNLQLRPSMASLLHGLPSGIHSSQQFMRTQSFPR